MAKSHFGKQVDDEAPVHTPNGVKTWYINRIEYNVDLIPIKGRAMKVPVRCD